MENPTTSPAPSSSSSTVPRSSPAVAGHSATWPLLPEPLSPAPTPIPNWNNIPPTPKPVSNLLAAFQATLSGHLAGRSLLDPEVQAATTTYNTLFYLSTMERAAEACDNVGQNAFKLTPLLRELNKAQSLNERATSRASREQRDKEKEAARLEREKERTHRRIIEMEHKERIEAIKLRRSECELQRVLARPAFKQRAADNKELRKPKSTRAKPKPEAPVLAPDPSIDPSNRIPDSDPVSTPDLIADSAPDSFSEISNFKSAISASASDSASSSEISGLQSAIPSPSSSTTTEALEPPTSSPDPLASPTPALVPPESSGGEDLLPTPNAESTSDSPPPSPSFSILNSPLSISSPNPSPSSSDRTPDSASVSDPSEARETGDRWLPDPEGLVSTPESISPVTRASENPQSTTASLESRPDSPPSSPSLSIVNCPLSIDSPSAPDTHTSESIRSARENTCENEKTESKPQNSEFIRPPVLVVRQLAPLSPASFREMRRQASQ